MRPSIDEYFLGFARQAATRATCLRKKVGAVITREGIMLASGYNGSIRGMPHCDEPGVGCLMEDNHCVRTVHAEANAILQAAKNGVRIDGATLYSTASPCWPCFGLIANSGIKRIVFGEAYRATDPGPKRVTEVASLVGIELVSFAVPAAHGLECPGCLEEHTTRHQVPRDQHTCRYRTVQKIGDPAGVAGAPEQDAVAGKPTGRFVREVWYSDEQLAEAAAQRFAHNADPATRHGGQPVSETVVMALCDICEAPAYVTCSCQRCVSEPDDDERYHACNNHLDDVTAKHMRVRGLGTVWVRR